MKKAKLGDLPGLQEARANHRIWDTRTCWLASKYGNVDCLRYAHENGCPWDAFTLIEAIKNHNYDCFLYALQQNCPYNSMVTYYLARDGNVALMEKCKHIPLHPSAIYEAIKYNHLPMVKYMYEQGLQWSPYVAESAVGYGNTDVLEYVIQNGCSYMIHRLVDTAIEYDRPQCLAWILRNLFQALDYGLFEDMESYAITYKYFSLLLALPFLNEVAQLFLKETNFLHDYLPKELVYLIYEYT